ncbi:MAG: rod shape-determining protein MreC [Verrucomicrobiota bacterium JB022]|nr:rod shape-determining protein MreC [Verrucomicrobiota bacterium JB022]
MAPERSTFVPLQALVLVGGLVAVWWLLPLGIKAFLRVTFWEFQAPSYYATSQLHDLQDYWAARVKSKNDLIEANIDLARLNAAYSLRNQAAEATAEELRRIEELLDLPPLPRHRYEVARVVRRDMNAWWQRIIIRKGSMHGLEVGQAVVFRGGVVGRVSEVYTYTAAVELVTSREFRVAAHFEGDPRPVQFQGGLNATFHAPTGEVSTVPPDKGVSLGQPLTLVSSRLGGVFPDGLKIGDVYQLDPGADGLFQSGLVRLPDELQSLEEVAVLIPLQPSEEADIPTLPTR